MAPLMALLQLLFMLMLLLCAGVGPHPTTQQQHHDDVVLCVPTSTDGLLFYVVMSYVTPFIKILQSCLFGRRNLST